MAGEYTRTHGGRKEKQGTFPQASRLIQSGRNSHLSIELPDERKSNFRKSCEARAVISLFCAACFRDQCGVVDCPVMQVLLAFAFVVAAISLRITALSVQERVIRVEMRRPLQQALPAELRGRIPDLR
jgi:hypothetical protein